MDDGCHVYLHRAVQTKLLGDARDFICREHDTKTQEHIAGECHHPQEQECGLHKGGQTQCSNLLAPLVEPIAIPSGDRKHVKRTHGDLNQQDTAALDVGEEYLNNAVNYRLKEGI